MKQVRIAFMVVLTLLAVSLAVFAHGGKTDSKSGHRDNHNVSGLGAYHFHCGGYPAHLHPNGVCPYTSKEPFATAEAEPEEVLLPVETPAPSTDSKKEFQEKMYREEILPRMKMLVVMIPITIIFGIILYRKEKQ